MEGAFVSLGTIWGDVCRDMVASTASNGEKKSEGARGFARRSQDRGELQCSPMGRVVWPTLRRLVHLEKYLASPGSLLRCLPSSSGALAATRGTRCAAQEFSRRNHY
eukprot:7961219-Pyramimonas_sp.AAC.1